MIEECPLPRTVDAAGEVDLEAVVARDADGARAAVPEQRFDLGGVLRVRRAAEGKAVGEEAGPILADRLALLEAAAEAVLLAFLAVGVVQVPPVPACEGFIFIGGD